MTDSQGGQVLLHEQVIKLSTCLLREGSSRENLREEH